MTPQVITLTAEDVAPENAGEEFPMLTFAMKVDPGFSSPFTWRERAARMALEKWVADGQVEGDDGLTVTVKVSDETVLRMRPEYVALGVRHIGSFRGIK